MRKRRRVFKLLGLCFAVVMLATVLSGCQTVSYYKQAIRGQYQIFANRERIEKLIASTNTPAELKEKFRLVMDLRHFAETELKLPVDGHYNRYVDVKRRFVVWNVHGAQEFSLEPKTWWYPVVGRLKYRGFFSEPQAKRYAKKLQEQGLDVYVNGVEAYSTLGWFKDPLLNTFIHHDEIALAEILFHELAHQRVFASGDTDFNEAFATAAAEEAVRRWFRNKPAQLEQFRVQQGREEDFVRVVLATRDELKRIYAHTNESPAALRHQKLEAIDKLRTDYARLKQAWGGYGGYDGWFRHSLNNAQLNTVATYHHFVPAFRELLRKQGGDLDKFYREVEALSRVPKKERHRRLFLHDREKQTTNTPLQPSPGSKSVGARPASVAILNAASPILLVKSSHHLTNSHSLADRSPDVFLSDRGRSRSFPPQSETVETVYSDVLFPAAPLKRGVAPKHSLTDHR